MKLSANEVKLISEVETRCVHRKWGAWISFLTVVALLVATDGYGMLPSLRESSLLYIAAGAALPHLIYVYFVVRTEDKLADLLQRYVNRDPEAVAQISGATENDGVAA